MKTPFPHGSCARLVVGFLLGILGWQAGAIPADEIPGGWSKPVRGLSMRLVIDDGNWTMRDDPCQFLLEIKNVGQSPVILPAPHVMPTLCSAGEGPYDANDFNCRILAEREGGLEGCFLWARREPTRAMAHGFSLAPGGRLRLKITCQLSGKGNLAEEAEKELTQDSFMIEREENVSFPYSQIPGRYTVKAILKIARESNGDASRKNWWFGSLESLPKEVVVHQPSRQEASEP